MALTPLLICLAMFGTDPTLVFSDASESRDGLAVVLPTLASTAPRATPRHQSGTLTESESVTEVQPVFRAQCCDQAPCPMFCDTPNPMGLNDGYLHDLIAEFNPFATINIRTLPNYYDPYGWQERYGNCGYQPWRLGWVTYNDFRVLPSAPVTSGTTGQMQVVEWNSNIRISEVISPGVLFTGTGWFSAHWWDGPGGVALPGQVDQVSTDLELGFFNNGPWSGQIAFHPQIVNGYETRINRYSFNFDGRAIATYTMSNEWSFVGGVAFWDRVDVLVVPNVGVIWAPDSRWELRLLYPKSRISYFLGRHVTTDFWLYGEYEYTAESWQADIGKPAVVHDRIQITDDRLALGVRWDTGRYSFFAEAGYVFNRQAKFIGPTPDFNLGNIEMFRVGARY